MKKFKIYASGIQKAEYIDTIEAVSEEDATEIAYEYACSDYESYEGLHGIPSMEDIMEDEEISDYDTAWEVYAQERESWLDYYAEEI